ncbi:uncharacterized protein G2W53_018124 [Senna tora]|uniref:F-box protein n=1 Tax=Senna tora TaxID=362788 RepID=A0A834TV98_9FABA|nr:uncharacterized protein G2W53_018124 [Senna tora]
MHTEMGHDHVNPSFLLGSRFVSAEEAYGRLITISSNADGEEILNYLRLHPHIEQNMSIDLLGTYNGLLFVKVTNNDETVRLFICNPATRRQFPTILHFDLADHIFSTICGLTNRPVVSYIPVEFEGSLAIICAELQAPELVQYITMQLMYDVKSQQYWWPVLFCPYANDNTYFVGFVDNQFVMQYCWPLHVECYGRNDIVLLNFDSTRSWNTLRAIQKDPFVEIYPSNIFKYYPSLMFV